MLIKKTGFLWMIALLLLSYSGYGAYVAPKDTIAEVAVYNLKDSVPAGVKIIDDFKIGDNGFTTDCQYERVIEKAKERAVKLGGNAIKITEVKSPDAWSSCYRIKGNILQVSAAEHTTKMSLRAKALEEDDETPADTSADFATLYLYRSKSFTGSAIGYDVYMDDSVICRMTNNSKYEIKIHQPGAHKIWAKTEAKAIVPLNIKPGKSYYVKCGIQVGLWVGQPQLTLVYPSQGKEEYELVKGKKEK